MWIDGFIFDYLSTEFQNGKTDGLNSITEATQVFKRQRHVVCLGIVIQIVNTTASFTESFYDKRNLETNILLQRHFDKLNFLVGI